IIQLNVSFLVVFAHPGAMTPMGAELNQIFRPYWGMGATHMHPGAITPMGAILNTTTAAHWPPATTRSVVNERRSNAHLQTPEGGDSDVELLEDDSDIEFLGDGGEEGKGEIEL
ncbi:unnamed protein product, partial [Pylaiella littoralis]